MEGKGGRGGGAQAFNSSMNTITTTTSTSSSTPLPPPPPTTRAASASASEGAFIEQQQPQGLPRRRTGSHKRKANTSNNSSSSAAAKRQARERNLSAIPLHLHNGPITRARQSPNKSAITAAEASVSASVAAGGGGAAAVVSASTSGSPLTQNQADLSLLQIPSSTSGGEVTNATQESKTAYEELQAALEPDIDAEFEAIRSRDDNAHVIPTPAGWFSWTKVHPLEEHALASFFNGKSEKRTPDIYLEIRNLIVRKFHEDAKTQIEPKDLAELSVGELDARKEVMEFLDHWGLINFHPFPLSDSGMAVPDADGATKMASLIEKLYHFETVQPRQRIDSRVDLAKPAVLPSLFPESAIAEEVRPEGPSVEYHCNSCSADCSRKRYHCQKQADFDLCSDCYSNGKFDSGMSPADFILMEPAEVPGVSGGSWTDQETLLLLEALELYGENWNEIAEHVATKTKAQCILHFVQMPIEDTFLEGEDGLDASLLGSIVPGSTGDDSASKDAPERRESGLEANNDSTSSKNTPDTTEGKSANDNDSSVLRDAEKKDDTETTESGNATNEELPLSSAMDISKAKGASEVELPQEMSANCALNALKEAFQAVGCLPEPGGPLSFAEAGNPVMALAAYLACLVEPDVAAASARSSLKTVSEDSPGIQLAARHCFLLEDSPDGRNVIPAVESADAEMVDGETPKEENQKGENQESENQKEVNRQDENHASVSDGSEVPKSSPAIEMDEAVPEEKKSLLSSGDEERETSNSEKKPVDKTIPEDVISNAVKEPGDSALPGEDPPSTVKEPADTPLPAEVTLNAVKESGDSALLGEDPLSTAKESIDMQLPAEITPNCIKELGDGLGEISQCPEVTKVEDMVSDSTPLEEKESKQTVASNMKVENEANAGVDDKKKEDCKEEKNCGLTDSKDDHNIDRIRRAAITALSAAAVKAKLLADQEEDQIQQLATYLVEKQLHKLEMKLSFFTEMEGVITKVREQMDRSRQKLYHERAQIIATRLGLPASSSRTIPPSLPNRLAMNYANSVPKPQQGMNFQRPPVRINPNTSAPQLSSSSIPSSASGASSRASYQDKHSSVGNS